MSNYRGPIARTHPLTGEPLRPLGVIAGRPVWPIMGGSAPAPEAPPAADPAAPPAQPPAAPAAPAPTPQPPAPPATPAPQPPAEPKAVEVADTDTTANLLAKYTPEELAAYAVRLREEAKRGRTGAKKTAADEARTELAQQIGKALGLVPDDDPAAKVTPEQLTTELTAAREAARTAAVQLELYRTAAQHGAIAGDLLSLVVLRDTADLDPKAPDFSAKVIAAAQAAVTANPVLKAAPAAARSGAEFTGGPGAPSTPTTLEEAIAAKMGG